MGKRLLKIKEKHKEYHFEVPFKFNGFFEEDELYAQLFEIMTKLSENKEFSTFKVAISWPRDLKDEAQKFHLKYAFQSKLNKEFAEKFNREVNFSIPQVIFLIQFDKEKVLMRLGPTFVFGKYCKFSRSIAQTEYFCNKCYGHGCWYCKDTGHFSTESVEELMGEIFKKHFLAKDFILHGAGREDMDVLMLGNGRPFIMEMISPEVRTIDFAIVEKEINETLKEKVSVNSLRVSSQNEVSPLKDNPHDKIYKAIVSVATPFDSHILGQLIVGKEMDVLQKTPTRVAKRRADLERAKKVTVIENFLIDSNKFSLTLKTSHGTYVKEFISGDGEKTSPSISSILGVHCHCKQLDVMEICE